MRDHDGEPNGDYTAYCWLDLWGWDYSAGWEFNDENCNACSDWYLCSSNGADLAPTPAPTISPAPSVTFADSSACADAEHRAWHRRRRGDNDKLRDLWERRAPHTFFGQVTGEAHTTPMVPRAHCTAATRAACRATPDHWAVHDQGCSNYIHMDYGYYGVWLDGGSTSLEDCAGGGRLRRRRRLPGRLLLLRVWGLLHRPDRLAVSATRTRTRRRWPVIHDGCRPHAAADPVADSDGVGATVEGICTEASRRTKETPSTASRRTAGLRHLPHRERHQHVRRERRHQPGRHRHLGAAHLRPRRCGRGRVRRRQLGVLATPTATSISWALPLGSGGANYDDCCSDTWSQAANSDDMASYTGVGWTRSRTSPSRGHALHRAQRAQRRLHEYCWLYIYLGGRPRLGLQRPPWVRAPTGTSAAERVGHAAADGHADPDGHAGSTESPCCPDEFHDCGTFCDYDGDCYGDNYCGDGSWDLCDDDWDDNCIICCSTRAGTTPTLPARLLRLQLGLRHRLRRQPYNEHTDADSEQYWLAQVAYSCSDLPDNGYYYYGGDYYGDYYYYGNNECDDDYAWFWGVEINDDLEGQWSSGLTNAILTYEDCHAAQAWADECEWPPSVSEEYWDDCRAATCRAVLTAHGSSTTT